MAELINYVTISSLNMSNTTMVLLLRLWYSLRRFISFNKCFLNVHKKEQEAGMDDQVEEEMGEYGDG